MISPRLKKLLGVIFPALLFSTQVCGQNSETNNSKKIFVYENERGHLVFTDQPRPGARLVNMNHNTLTMPATDTAIFTTATEQQAPQAVEYKLAITRPTAEQTIRDNNGVVQVSAQLTPHLGQGHKFRLKLDGQIRQKPHANAHFVLRDVDRGEHNVVMELLNDKNEVIASSEAITFYLFRASKLHNKQQNQ